MTKPYKNQGSVDADFLNYIARELIEQPNRTSLNRLSGCVAATVASMQFSAVLPMVGLPSPEAASPSSAVTSTATPMTSPASPT
jgi:hypothetical protein